MEIKTQWVKPKPGSSKGPLQWKSVLIDHNIGPKGSRVLQFDAPHGKQGYHINTVDERMLMNSKIKPIQSYFVKKYNHKEIPKSTYNILHDYQKFEGNVLPKIKRVGKALAVVGVVSDFVDLGGTMYLDLTDEDQKLGKKTLRTSAGIAGSWAGAVGGAKAGAIGGAAIGSFFPGPGTLIGSFVGGLIGGTIGAFSGGALGDHIVDKTYQGE